MELNVQHKEERPLLQRTDLRVRVAYEGAAPKREALRDAIAHSLKSAADTVIIRRITTEFGKQAAIIEASVYKDGQALLRFEPKHMQKRHGMAVAEKTVKKAAAEGGK